MRRLAAAFIVLLVPSLGASDEPGLSGIDMRRARADGLGDIEMIRALVNSKRAHGTSRVRRLRTVGTKGKGDSIPGLLLGQEEFIIGGEFVDGYPAVAALVLNNGAIYCTVTVISKRTALTAAHCFDDFPPTRFFLATGPNASLPEKRYPIVGTRVPGSYRKGMQGADDIALAYLAEDFVGGTIALPPGPVGNEILAQPLNFIGYGYAVIDLDGTLEGIGRKAAVKMPVRSIAPTTFDYSVSGKNTCNGDSGGPALLTVGNASYIVGVTSWGDKGCRKFGVDMRVDAYLPWIRAGIKP